MDPDQTARSQTLYVDAAHYISNEIKQDKIRERIHALHSSYISYLGESLGNKLWLTK
jgi:hypothetical protein